MESKRNVVMIVVGGLVALVVVVGIAVGTAMLVTNRLAAAPAREAQVTAGPSPLDLMQIELDPPFVTNLKDEGKPRYIELGVTLLVRDKKVQERLAEAKPILQDSILTVLTSKTSAEVMGEAGKNQLAADIVERLNKTLGGAMIEQVLFTKFVVQ